MSRRLLVPALLLVASLASADDWQFLGPRDFGARVISLAVDPKNADHVFAGSASGGLWENTDVAKGSWHYVNTGFPILERRREVRRGRQFRSGKSRSQQSL